MASSNHTYGPTCHLTRVVTFPGSKGDDDIPVVKPQFFYSSPLPIDDPLAAVPATSGTDSKATKYNPRPFSAYDSNALEEAWLGLLSKKDRKHLHKPNDAFKPLTKAQAEKRALLVSELATNHNKKHASETFSGHSTVATHKELQKTALETQQAPTLATSPSEQKSNKAGPTRHSDEAKGNLRDPDHIPMNYTTTVCCTELENDCKLQHRKLFGVTFKRRETKADLEKFILEVIKEAHQQKEEIAAHVGKSMQRESKDTEKSTKYGDIAPAQGETADGCSFNDTDSIIGSENLGSELHTVQIPGNPGTGTTGSPFKRVPDRDPSTEASSRPATPAAREDMGAESEIEDHTGRSHRPAGDSPANTHNNKCKAYKEKTAVADVPVGISRLHLVKLPQLQMMPIYWSPVHDISAVTRATWFYKNTMYPVEAPVANQLELGYRELRPWSQTWSDELNSAIDVGASGEEKISHRLWPKESDQKIADQRKLDSWFMPTDPYCAARCFGGAVAASGTVDPDHADEKSPEPAPAKRFSNSHVIYKDAQNAFVLKTSLQPSEYFNRKPVAKIMKGATVGIQVVRGFDWRAWEKLHPTKKSKAARRAEDVVPVAENADAAQRSACSACLQQEERPKVTDLVLVIHGIGQKLSERVESFHFTHAINAFRRSVNIELGNEAVQNVLRDGLGGIMVLPVNWRSNLTLDAIVSDFSLKDITPDTIPAVRSVISEVVMDVPYYMSNHRSKMNEALTTEANRVYRLWCRNNPYFQKEGRVHIIAHSLGSAMAMDILSRQPTFVGRCDLNSKKIPTKNFEFDTKNLFFAGSPAGLFLLLDRARLIPRNGRNKPGADLNDGNAKNITGEVGTFGCLAVDNLYNILHQNDPIACSLNATVDSLFASSLRNAQVPNTTIGWLGTIGNAMRAITPGTSTTPDLGVGQLPKPPVVRLPSQLEMAVHDFTREEIAEKKFYLLNDNGQIDYFLSSGGGPLEIQYLNMLSAHSSYWVSPDFVRMLVIEVGRKPGRSNTLPNMKARKKIARK